MENAADLAEAGWSILWYYDTPDEALDKLALLLKPYGLKLEYYDGECDGFQPFRLIDEKVKA